MSILISPSKTARCGAECAGGLIVGLIEIDCRAIVRGCTRGHSCAQSSHAESVVAEARLVDCNHWLGLIAFGRQAGLVERDWTLALISLALVGPITSHAPVAQFGVTSKLCSQLLEGCDSLACAYNRVLYLTWCANSGCCIFTTARNI